MLTLYDSIERAFRAEHVFILDRHYVVRDGEIVIVDEFTGRIAEGRKWRDGLHQAVEAKENVEVTIATGQAARVTIQDFFLRYPRLAGMTGTASTSAGELRKDLQSRAWCQFPRTGRRSANDCPSASSAPKTQNWPPSWTKC